MQKQTHKLLHLEARLNLYLDKPAGLLPVIAVEVIQPAAFLHQLDGARVVSPGGVAVQPLVLLPLAALHAALVGLLQLPVGIVIDALPCLSLPMAWSWKQKSRPKNIQAKSELDPGNHVLL